MTPAEKREYDFERYHGLKNAGLCVECKETAVPGQSRCARCRDKNSEVKGQIRADRIERGECVRCGQKHDRETRYCRACSRWDSKRKRKPERKRVLRCTYCKGGDHNRRSCEARERDEHQARLLEAAGARRAA